ncbi:MAG: hypothetical protein ACP5H8_02255 [Candidatus Micrarchaeia archaeon]
MQIQEEPIPITRGLGAAMMSLSADTGRTRAQFNEVICAILNGSGHY